MGFYKQTTLLTNYLNDYECHEDQYQQRALIHLDVLLKTLKGA